MGCTSSRLDAEGGFPMPFKARPTFLNHRLDDIKTRRNSQTPTLTLSKKELLLKEEEDHDHDHVSSSPGAAAKPNARRKSSSFDQENESCVTSEGGASENNTTSIKDLSSSDENKRCGNLNSESDEDDDDDQLDERMVRRKDDLGFPGSPSFRVYFNDTTNLPDNINKLGPGEVIPEDIAKVDASVSHKKVVHNSTDEDNVGACTAKGKVEYRQEKKQKRGRSFKNVLPRGGQAAMKNLLNVRSCMSSTPHAQDQTHRLLTPKTPAA